MVAFLKVLSNFRLFVPSPNYLESVPPEATCYTHICSLRCSLLLAGYSASTFRYEEYSPIDHDTHTEITDTQTRRKTARPTEP